MSAPAISLTAPFRYVLEGRLVTLGPQGVLPDGAVFIEDGVIRAVQPASAPAPAGFEDAVRVRTGDTLYPGLIELHNHLAYNAIPLWLVPRRYSNNGQWRGTHAYRRHVTAPARVLGSTDGLVEAVIRFVECRSLLGGTTTSQGITLIGVGTRDFFPGLVRNVEAPALPDLPAAATRIGNPPSREREKQRYLEQQAGAACYLQHLSEGVDATARNWFLRLRRQDGTWAIHNSLCGIHSAALLREDFDVLAAQGASMVWSPLSNYLLYGATADVGAVAASGIKVGLGSDWAPSGSKSLLGELKVAWLASAEAGGVFSAEDLVRMATINAAETLGWDAALGTLEPGKRADLVAVNGKTGDPFMQLIEARETSVTLVVIDGVPRVGQPRLMNRFQLDAPEDLQIGGSRRLLHLAQDDAHPLVQGLTLEKATQDLEDALARLPELAAATDNALLAGLEAGAAGSPLSRVRLDLELDDEPLGALAGSLADDVFPMKLEAITVADDPTFLPKMMAALNLPDFIKENLPGLYGASVPRPFEAEDERVTVPGLPPRVNATVGTLRQFLRSWRKFTLDQRKTVVDQALLILEQNYVHLPFKRSMHGVDPVQRLRLLRHRLDQTGGPALPPDIEFHAELTRIFHSLRDLHTTYRLPYPFRGVVAWLPFLVEEYWDDEEARHRYVISKVAGEDDLGRLEGAELLHWNGVPIETAIAVNADRQAGSNPDARRARGINALTIRPLGRGLPPDEDWVTLRYRGADGTLREARQEWLVFVPEPVVAAPDLAGAEALAASSLGLDDHTDGIQEAKKILYAPQVWQRERASAPGARIQNAAGALPTSMPTVFRAREVDTETGRLGHIRIFTFNVARADEFVEELGRLAEQLPEAGLLLDVRGNGGGLIPAAEGALQLFTSRRIEPQRAQFINTPLNLALCQMHPDDRADSVQLGRWVASIREAVQTGAAYSLGFPITSPSYLGSISQRYVGPVALITDALCYSATDLFAAGFQDHEIGPVVGVHSNTGAGGANVWPHGLLRRLWRAETSEASPYVPLPEGADFHVAMRRTLRVGLNAGGVVEDLGIRPDEQHRITGRDLMEGNRDLLDTAARALSRWHGSRAHIRIERRGGGRPRMAVSAPDGHAAELTVSFHVRRSVGREGVCDAIDLTHLLEELDGASVDVEVRGVAASGEAFSCLCKLGTNTKIDSEGIAMSTSYDHVVDAAFHGAALSELLDAPADALSGVSSADADHLRSAFGIQTVRDLGELVYFRRAAAMVEAASLHHDPGPPPAWAAFFASAPIDHYVNHPAGRFRLDFGPVCYRGRLDGSARVLVIGQDPSTNEILARRIFVGRSGQRIQRVLEKMGITRSYVMLNTFLFSVFGQFNAELEALSEEPEIEGYRNAFLDRIASENGLQAVVTFGRGARHAFERWPGGSDVPVFHAMHPAADEANVIESWNQILPGLRAAVDPDDGGAADPAPFGTVFTPEDLTSIPSFDLPFGVPEWHGQGGGHSGRDGDKKIVWRAP